MSFIYNAIVQSKKMLSNIDAWLDKATAHAKAKSFDPSVLLGARLAPDQYPLVRQIQVACDQAKFIAARLSGKEPPKHPDTEQTLDEIRARIRSTMDYLGTFESSDFHGSEARLVALPFLEGKVIRGDDFLLELALPNLYFHLTTAYAILRHNGVDLGKGDFIGQLRLHDK
jgi:uncharacterized protein